MKSEYFNHKNKKKFIPILSLTKTNGKNISNKSNNSLSSSELNSLSFSSNKIKPNKNSNNNSDKSVKPYNIYINNANIINRTQENSEAKLKKTFLLNLSNIKTQNNLKEKMYKIYDNNDNDLQLNKKKSEYRKLYASNLNKNGNILSYSPLKNNLKLNHLYFNSNKIFPVKKINNTIFKKFEGNFHNFYLSSLKKAKDEFVSKVEQINRTFYSNRKINTIEELPKNNPEKKNFFKNKSNNYFLDKKEVSNLEENSYFSRTSSRSKSYYENKLIKTKYSSQMLRVNKNHKRKRNFKEFMDEKNITGKNWKKKLDLIDIKTSFNPLVLNDLQFQSGIIKDELRLLLDDVQHFRFIFYEEQDIFSSFKNKDINYQTKINKILEESCALLHMIPKILLKEYYKYTDKYISITDPSKELFSKKVVFNEVECLQDNIKYLNKILNFVNCCYEVYSQLIEQVEDEMIITFQNFRLLKAILDKLRLYMIYLTNNCRNILKDYIFDKNIIDKFKVAIKKSKDDINYKNKDKKKDNIKNENIINIRTNENIKNETIKIKEYSDNESEANKNFNYYRNTDDIELNEGEKEGNKIVSKKGEKNLKFVENFLSQKMARITKALEPNSTPDKNSYKKGIKIFKEKMAKLTTGSSGPMALINSSLMTKMLKYIKKDYRQKIISLRTSQRFFENKI